MRAALALAAVALGAPVLAQDAGAPLSAIDWLSQSLEETAAAPPLDEPPVASNAAAPGIVVTPLDRAGGGAFGVLPPADAGLPDGLWAASDPGQLGELVLAGDVPAVPALRDMVVDLMLARAEPPAGSDGRGLLLARVDRLLDMGELEAAQRLLESGDLLDPELFRRWFDVTLLRGTEGEACAMLRSHPTLAPTLMARVFCTARNGDWNAAALTLNTARVLGDLSAEDEALLTRFLDPELAEDEPLPHPRPSPLVYRIKEAVGELLPTESLPLAFAHADLRDTVAWRAQIEAAERLARNGAVDAAVLWDAYTAREPAASGGVWDRAAAVQRLDEALGSGDPEAVAARLPDAWALMEEAGLEVPFAEVAGTRLGEMDLTGAAGALAYRIALLSPAYADVAGSRESATQAEALWRAVATGEVGDMIVTDAPGSAVLAAFQGATPPADVATALGEGRTGEAILRAVALFREGLDGDHGAITEALATLCAAGLDDTARRAALQYLILDARA